LYFFTLQNAILQKKVDEKFEAEVVGKRETDFDSKIMVGRFAFFISKVGMIEF